MTRCVPRMLLLCFGNELHGDDGFGPTVGRVLAEQGLPPGWELHQVGTRGLDALALLQDCDAAILVDAEAPAGQPGRLRERCTDELIAEPALAGHGMGLGFLLQALRTSGAVVPRLRILTAEMARLRTFEMRLSPEVAAAVDAAVTQLGRWMQSGRTSAVGARPVLHEEA